MTVSAALLRRAFAALATMLFALVAFAASAETAPALLVVGDSISAAYGLPPNTGWTTLLSRRLQDERYAYRVVNASISGDTTAGGRARLPALLREHKPAVVVIELGGNDGLRGGDLRSMRGNLETMVTDALHAGARVLLVGMRLPPNYGPSYTKQFESTYRDVAQKFKVPLVPFLFEGFGETNEWFQPDRIHPTLNAQPRVLDNVWPSLKPLLDKRR
jgi:acyl-CoA thioesterase-1